MPVELDMVIIRVEMTIWVCDYGFWAFVGGDSLSIPAFTISLIALRVFAFALLARIANIRSPLGLKQANLIYIPHFPKNRLVSGQFHWLIKLPHYFPVFTAVTRNISALSVCEIGELADDFCPNAAPVANAGGPYIAQATSWSGAFVNLNGTDSSDPDGDALAYKWDLDLSVDSDGDGDPNNDVDANQFYLQWYFAPL